MRSLRDEFLSEEDLDLRSLTETELYAYWDLWLHQAQATNDGDQDTYSHGVFTAQGWERDRECISPYDAGAAAADKFLHLGLGGHGGVAGRGHGQRAAHDSAAII